MNESQATYYRSFVILLLLVSIAFAWLLRPYYGAIFWGTVLAISFAPLHRRLAGVFIALATLGAEIDLRKPLARTLSAIALQQS